LVDLFECMVVNGLTNPKLYYAIWMFHSMYLLCASFHSTTLHI